MPTLQPTVPDSRLLPCASCIMPIIIITISTVDVFVVIDGVTTVIVIAKLDVFVVIDGVTTVIVIAVLGVFVVIDGVTTVIVIAVLDVCSG